MKIKLLLLLSSLLIADAKFEKIASKENDLAMENEKVKCRWVCDKKLYKEQKIAEAISFYKNSKDYNFTKKDFY
jgi:L-cysteine desulfidase